jgi:two-component system osmolarity sensor histidine kinase EnvZ
MVPRWSPNRLGIATRLRQALPRSLLGRSLLIILVPMVLLQAIALMFFLGNHLDVISRRLSGAVAGELAFVVEQMNRQPNLAGRLEVLRVARPTLGIDLDFQLGGRLADAQRVDVLGPWDDDLENALRERTRVPFTMDWTTGDRNVLVALQLPDGVLRVKVPRKRFYTTMLPLFVLWLVGTAAILFVIAAIFMRNQVRALRRLADAAEAFGLGRDEGPIRPEGATEVRQAATAFNRMQERLRRFLVQRTEMLAGVSHDLRTPLTRMRLALAMLPVRDDTRQDIAEMTADLAEMDRMIGRYLAFARGEGAEQVEPTELAPLLEDVAASARRAGGDVGLRLEAPVTLKLRPDAIRRAVTNLVDNARRHARHVEMALYRTDPRNVQVAVDDDGPGIPADQREAVFRPFESGSPSGTGLGLAIARDIVRAHGGEIYLEDSKLGGLRARIRLPV